ncbi:hypothetical protein ANN_24578 [Periplaneta americana]|uniref:Uncharacterized protein n=1 Tax=Periplaneta americana TaxID=6978 RepID=A0ABQ8S3D8_PERAM|nr:hypothetical protein ANN_24578 [Periplaneta americana]
MDLSRSCFTQLKQHIQVGAAEDVSQLGNSIQRTTRQLGVNPYGQSILDPTLADLLQNIPGEPGRDYPIYDKVPKTSFTCSRQEPPTGYFADVEARCQSFVSPEEIKKTVVPENYIRDAYFAYFQSTLTQSTLTYVILLWTTLLL